MDRRELLAGVVVVVAGCSNNGSTTDDERDFAGWVNPNEIEQGYTIVHISRDWELVPPEDAESWNDDAVERFRRGMCKRHFVYERIPDGYEILYQGRCEDGVTVTVEDDAGQVVGEIDLPTKDPNTVPEDVHEY